MKHEILAEGIEIYQSDCLEVMKGMADKSVDAVITDPPYGIGQDRKKVMAREQMAKPIDYGEFSWDYEPATAEQIDELIRVSKEQVIFGGNYFVLPPSSSWIVWDKLNTGDFADCELAWTSHNKAVRKFTYVWNGMIKQKPEKRYHPTQKPLALMLWVLENYTNPGDTILDPFMGSGTTGVACFQTGRNFIGIEIDKDYYKIARQRIKEALMQPRLL
jgi:DNA modification methylase